jgi:hypothetical protein
VYHFLKFFSTVFYRLFDIFFCSAVAKSSAGINEKFPGRKHAATAENHEGRRAAREQLDLATKEFESRLTWHAAILSR